ncbi:MAG: saccharopine dehydrogenase NADP-binding domain-containing protein [Burkholderiales bacterium]|nr:saccharopine dehydrogenase NADP-binding domain-containing protein [Burkholderiales bacterium]
MAKHPVVVYGASGYTGMLTMDWLIDQDIPFTAVARNAQRTEEMMRQRVVRLESARYEIVECAHDVAALTAAFRGARVVCNTVGPFVRFGLEGVQAALAAGCHHLDTTGEQSYVLAARERFGAAYADANLVLAPSTSYMYTLSEIAAELALETPGIDALETASLSRGPRASAGITVGSTASIFEMYRAKEHFLWDNALVEHEKHKGYEISVPELLLPVFCLPWSGTSLPVFFEGDPRVRHCFSLVGFYDNPAMRMVAALGQKWDAEYRNLPQEQQDAVLQQIVSSTTPAMPPRERTTLNRSIDIAVGRGQLTSVRAVVHSVTPYITTGALQTAAVMKLLDGRFAQPGFVSACQAFGHRYLLAFLEQRGLARASVTHS